MLTSDFSHLQMVEYNVQIGERITPKIAIFNCNKLPNGVVARCIETDTFNPYLLTMTREQFEALFLDDNPIDARPSDPSDSSAASETVPESGVTYES